MFGIPKYPISVRCDNKLAVNCTQMDGCNKLKTSDDEVEEIQKKLAIKEQTTGKKVPMSREHGNYVEICVQEKRANVIWIFTNENAIASINIDSFYRKLDSNILIAFFFELGKSV